MFISIAIVMKLYNRIDAFAKNILKATINSNEKNLFR